MKHMVVFFHGFASSPRTNKFNVIDREKICLKVDYNAEQYQDVDKNYHDLVESVLDEGYIPILVGHSLGGYWALRLAERFNVSCVIVNPQLWPTSELIRDVDMYDIGTEFRAPKYVYVETGDEVIDVDRTVEWAMKNSSVRIYEGGHHRVEKLDTINTLIDQAIQEELVS